MDVVVAGGHGQIAQHLLRLGKTFVLVQGETPVAEAVAAI